MLPKGAHQRGYLPHRDFAGSIQAITFREAGSLPSAVVAGWKDELRDGLNSLDQVEQEAAKQQLLQRIAQYEDAGHGPCVLRQSECARIVQEMLIKGHGVDYRLISWCIMPNHVHVMICQKESASLGAIIRTWKGGSSRLINQSCQQQGRFWALDYFDRAIRDHEHFGDAWRYIRQNPVKACLVEKPEDWAYSSAGYGWPMPMG